MKSGVFDKKAFIQSVRDNLKNLYRKTLEEADQQEIFQAVSFAVKDVINDRWLATQQVFDKEDPKIVYYMSMEFLMGRALGNNLINLKEYKEVREALDEIGLNLDVIEDQEPDPALGNGGLGRLAACFMDSIATLGLPGEGIGLNYHFGLFKQVFRDKLQCAEKNEWMEKESWLTRTDISFDVFFGRKKVVSRLYDIDVPGYDSGVNKLRLFDIESIDESLVKKGIDFDKEAIEKNLTLFLYPDDSDEAGRILRVYQQYFMVSNAAHLILDEAVERGSNLHDLADYATIQINDTHPSMVIPELIRLLMQKGIRMEEAIEIVTNTCAYTNHTILAEALEKWPSHYLQKAVPQLLPIIYELNNKVNDTFHDKSLSIIDDEDRIHMAHMDIHYGYSVNGVAYLHTEILKNTELNNFYKVYPEKFNNKTNGITFRRWLLECNHPLADLLTELIGDGYKKDATELEKLAAYADDSAVLEKLLSVKQGKKKDLAAYLKETQNITVNPDSVFDIQIKRLHEYKRQQMNALYVIDKYFEIKEGKLPKRPITVIFGAKAAPAYVIAKDIIHVILCLQEIIANDPEVSPYLSVVMVENYNVTLAEKLIPPADIHEQISLASKEASGTSNMKFMLNGAIAIGTEDGANVEMHEFVGDDNIYIFGESSDEVIAHYEKADYVSKNYYENDPTIKRAIDFLVSDTMMAVGKKENLERLYNELLNKDWFMTLPDFEDYKATKERIYTDYEDRMAWAKKMLINISKAGFFSSDRTIAQYNEDIWHL